MFLAIALALDLQEYATFGAGTDFPGTSDRTDSSKVLTKTVEPFLLRSGLVVKDDGGRRNLTEIGQEHLTSLRPANE